MSLKYTIQRGDTLSGIAQSMKVNMVELAEANGIEDANKIQAGRKLSMPSPPREPEKVRAVQEQMLRSQNQGVKKEAVIQEKKYALPQQTKRDERKDAAVGYAVKPGDTFNAVAKARGVSVERLRALNPEVKDPNKISVGQNLRYQEEEPGFKDKIMSFFTGDDENTKKPSILVKPVEAEESLDSTFVPSPVKLVLSSLFGKGTGQTYGADDVGEDVVSVVSQVASNARAAGRMSTGYNDYPDTKSGLPIIALVGAVKYGDGTRIPQSVRREYRKQRDAMYPKNPIGLAKFVRDVATDPVVKAALTVGGFNIRGEEGAYSVNDRFNFNSANQSKDDWFAYVRNKLTNSGLMPIGEDQGLRIKFKI
tara:strand:+ start:394 stop:1488 length:1095 start_codon:yes stop_codon:yes gene_type:complete